MISFDWTLLLQAGNFLVLLFILNLLLYRPLVRIMDERQERIEGSHRKAGDLDKKIQERMEAYRAKLQDAKQTANEERGAMRKSASEEEAKILQEASRQASDRLQKVRNRVADEAETARKSLRSDADKLAHQVASKVLGRSI